MTPQQLRASLLQQALSGRLTEQRPEDGAADALYEAIQQEKARLIAEKKIKKEKPLPPITEEDIPFDIPDTWKWVRLGEVIDVRDGTHDTPGYVVKGIPLVTSKNLSNGKIDFSSAKFISEEDAFKINQRSRVDNQDILFAMIGTIGNPVLVKKDREFCIKNMALFKPINLQLTFMTYVFYFLQYIQQKLKKEMNGGVQIFVSLKSLRRLLFPLPPLTEQQRIVAKLEELLPLVDQYGDAAARLADYEARFPDDLRKSLLQEAITGRLVPQRPEDGTADALYEAIQQEKARLIAEKKIKKEKPLPPITEEDIPFDIPDTWKWVRLRAIVYDRGQTKPTEKFSYIDIGSIDNMKQRLNMEEKILEPEKAPSRARKIVDYGDVIYSTVRPYLHNACIIDRKSDYPQIASTGFAAMTCCQGVLNKFLLFYLLSPSFDAYANSNQNAKGVAYPAINDQNFYRAVIPLPPLAEQQRIVAKLEELLPLAERIRSAR